MNFYFAGSIRAGRNDVPIYQALIAHLKQRGPVFTEHVGDYRLSLEGQTTYTDTYIHDRDLSWLRRSDVVVAETTNPSLGVGYEIAFACHWNIPVIVLHRREESSLSAMIAGSRNVQVFNYQTVEQATATLDSILNELQKNEER